MDKLRLQKNQGKEFLKRNIAERLETKWNIDMAYAHLRNMNLEMLKSLQELLIYKELTIDSNPNIKKKSGYGIKMIRTIKSLENKEVDNQ